MDILFGILAVVVAIGVVVFVLGRRAVTTGVDPTQLTFDPGVMSDVTSLALAGKKIQAIALLRESAPGLSLAAAKAMVDRMELSANRPRPTGQHPQAPADPVAPAAEPTPEALGWSFETAPSTSAVPFEVELEARNLKAQGQGIAAAELVREQTSMSIEEATDYVDGI